MELQKQASTPNSISAYQDLSLTIGQRIYHQSVLVNAQQIISPWTPLSSTTLTIMDLDALDLQAYELVIIGDVACNDGRYQSLQIALSQRGVGIEVMNLGAACRTFNLLLAENRQVLGLFRLED